jgi:tetratricopeptide (TPR) repeat protein
LLSATAITTWQARVARHERDNAERRFNQVRKLANTVLFEYHDGIEKLPGSTPMREKMVKDALEYLDNLSAESAGDASLQAELASAYFKVGEVQGAPSKSSLGDYAGALVSFKKALGIRERLYAKDPQNEKLKLDLTRSYQMVGSLSQATDDIPRALEYYRKAFVVFDAIADKSVEAERDLSTLHTRFASALSAAGDLEKAIENYQKAIVILTKLLSTNPDKREVRRGLGVANILLGDALTTSGQVKEALAADRAALALLEPLASPTNAQSRRDVGVANARISDGLSRMGDNRGALEIQLKVLAGDEELAKADPANALAQRDIQVDYYKIARLQSDLGDMKSAVDYERKSIALCEAAVKSNPASSEARADLATALFHLGEMLNKSGDVRDALQNYKKALAIGEALTSADPANAAARGDLAQDYLKVGDMNLKLGNGTEALEDYRKALAIREPLVAANPDDVEGRSGLAGIYQSFGEYNFGQAKRNGRSDDWQEARRRYQQSLDIWIELKNKGKLTSEDAGKPSELTQKLAACDAALARLSTLPGETGSRP